MTTTYFWETIGPRQSQTRPWYRPAKSFLRRLVGVGVLAGSFSVALVARAERATAVLPVGGLAGFGSRGGDFSGTVGGEASLVCYPDKTRIYQSLGIGAFAQVEAADGFDHLRVDFGPQLNWSWIGLETGWAIEAGNSDHVTTESIHLAPFVSLAFASLAFKTTIPVASSSSEQRYDMAFAAIFTVKIPIALNGKLIELVPR